MDIFKLFFNHDQRLDKLAKRNANKTPEEVEATLQDFMTPTPTFSKFYITGTRLEQERFGLDTLDRYEAVREALQTVFEGRTIHAPHGAYSTLARALPGTAVGQGMIITDQPSLQTDPETLQVDEESNVGHLKDELRAVLLDGHWVMYKEQAHHGFDLHLFSRDNIYPKLFGAFQPLVSDTFRFFSINSKRMGSEKHFYFETWTLDKPPHGAEEVLAETAI